VTSRCRQRLAHGEREGIHLKVVNHKLDDDWLYIVVVPSRAGVRKSEYAYFMSKIERELSAQGEDQVLLVPALED
jgi:hypothetical protein